MKQGGIHCLSVLGEILAKSQLRKHAEESLKKALDEIRTMKEQLEAENIYLREKLEAAAGFTDIVGTSDPNKYVSYRIKQVANTRTTVLLTVVFMVVLFGALMAPSAFGHSIDYIATDIQPQAIFSGQSGHFQLVDPIAAGGTITFNLTFSR